MLGGRALPSPLGPLPGSPYLSPGGRVPVQARRALAGELRQWFVEDSLAVEGPQEPLVSGVDAMHVPNLHPPATAPGALGNDTSITPGKGSKGRCRGNPSGNGR